jgi:hypothetical protein
MGWFGYPVYGENVGSTIENVEKLIAKIKTNKFDKEDLVALSEAIVELKTAIEENAD